MTGQVSYEAAIPIIMGQNIGTCITAMLSSVGTNKNARRAALVHLSFNIIGTAFWLSLFGLIQAVWHPELLNGAASRTGIATCHSIFNLLCTVLLLPNGKLLEKLAYRLIPDSNIPDPTTELDERLLATPTIALQRCRDLVTEMAANTSRTFISGIKVLHHYEANLAEQIRKGESLIDHYEDILGTYQVKLSSLKISVGDTAEAATLLKAIGDFERISDHSVNLVEAAEELHQKDLEFSVPAKAELEVLFQAVSEAMELSFAAFIHNDLDIASKVEPLEEVIDTLKEQMRTRHILRLQQGGCSIETGFIWSDLLTCLERIGDHCSNLAGCVIDLAHHNMNTHETLRNAKMNSSAFHRMFQEYATKYRL